MGRQTTQHFIFETKTSQTSTRHTVHKMNTDNCCSRRERRVRKPDGTTFRLWTSGNCGSWELHCSVLGSSGVLFCISLIIMHGTKFNNTARVLLEEKTLTEKVWAFEITLQVEMKSTNQYIAFICMERNKSYILASS